MNSLSSNHPPLLFYEFFLLFFILLFSNQPTHDTKILNAYMTKLKHYITVVYDNKI